MNAYVVRTKDRREYTEPIMDDGSGPRTPYLPIAPVIAETPAQAKRLFLDHFSRDPHSGVYSDDWPRLLVRLLRKNVDNEPGLREDDDELWWRVHEVIDHNGAECNASEDEPCDSQASGGAWAA